jgi:molecular chaperone DnaK
MPYLRERLADAKNGLGIPLEFSVDPLTVVARGAAMFAGTRRLEGIAPPPLIGGQYAVELDYQPVSPTPEPVVGGQVEVPEGRNLAEFTISASASRPILMHSVGLVLPTNETIILLSKGTPLPARSHVRLLTVKDVLAGQLGHILHIPVVEEEHGYADRNRQIGLLRIASDRIKRDLPVGSEVEVTIEIDQSRLVRTKAYVPLLDEEFENVVTLEQDAPDSAQLRRDLDRERWRLADVRKKAQELQNMNALQALRRIDGQRMEQDVEGALDGAQGDRDATYRARDRLLDLRAAIDEAEEAMEWPAVRLR